MTRDRASSVCIWSTSEGRAIGSTPAFQDLYQAVLSDDGSRVLAVGGKNLVFWDVPSGSVRTQTVQTGIIAGAFDPGGEHVITAEADWVIRTRDTRKLSVIAETQLDGAGYRMESAAFDASIQRIVTVDQDGGPARVWQVVDGQQIAEVRGPEEWFTQAALSPDGRTLVTNTRNGEIRLWPLGPGGRALTPSELRSHLCKRILPKHRRLHIGDGWRLAWRLVPADPCEWCRVGDIDFWRRIPVAWERLARGVGAASPPSKERVIVHPGLHRIDF